MEISYLLDEYQYLDYLMEKKSIPHFMSENSISDFNT